MKSVTASMKWVIAKLSGRKISIVLVVLAYLFMTVLYMGPSVWHCSDTVYGFGDNTAGPIWQHDVSPSSPMGGYISVTNYPVGENINSPVGYSLILQKSFIWTMQKAAGSVCGYNIVNAVGYFFSAFTMFLFIWWLTKNKWIALLAGYLVSFNPYFQFKVGGHPSYGYQGLIILSIWMMLKAYTERKRSAVIGFVLATSACFYWDPYFSLLVFSALFPIGLSIISVLLFKNYKQNRSRIIGKISPLLWGLMGIVIMLMPLAAIKVIYKDSINSYVSGARGDIMVDAVHCSVLPTDYFIPPDANYFYSKALGPQYGEKVQTLRHGCNPSEENTLISWSVIATIFVGGTILCWEFLNKRRSYFGSIPAGKVEIWLGLLLMGVFAAIVALPPTIGNIKTPSFILLSNVKVWRIIAREFIVVQLAVVSLFSIILLNFSRTKTIRNKRNLKIMLMLIVALLSFVHYQVTKPFSGSVVTFNYKKNIPQTYHWLEKQNDIKVIADYPLDRVGESEASTYFLTAQTIHKKQLLNSSLPNSPQESLRFSIKDLTDPQTLPALRSLGVDAVIIHGVPKEKIQKISGLALVHYEEVVDKFTGGALAVAKILPGEKSNGVIVLKSNFPINGLIMKSPVDLEYEAIQDAKATTAGVVRSNKVKQKVCFDVKMAAKEDGDTLEVRSENGKVISKLNLNDQYQTVSFETLQGSQLVLHNSSGHNMRLNNLGCPSGTN